MNQYVPSVSGILQLLKGLALNYLFKRKKKKKKPTYFA